MKNNTQNKYISVFCDRYRERNPFKKILYRVKQMKWAYQRATRGYADIDAWEIRGWFLNVMPAMLDRLAESADSYPDLPEGKTFSVQGSPIDKADNSMQGWRTLLHYMAQKFRDAEECEAEFRQERMDEALDLFRKWFWDLWD